jgi:hypothetical protein
MGSYFYAGAIGGVVFPELVGLIVAVTCGVAFIHAARMDPTRDPVDHRPGGRAWVS